MSEATESRARRDGAFGGRANELRVRSPEAVLHGYGRNYDPGVTVL
jgi:hypothetical protein